MRKLSLLPLLTYITFFLSAVRAFSVTVGTPTQCDNLLVTWTGGQAPFEIVVTPFAQPLHNISVPASAFSNGQGSYSIPQFPFSAGTKFLLTMSDATGFGSGGTTTILTVGSPVANNNCNTATNAPDFWFSTPLQLQQCSTYTFTDYSGAVLPATITALIPGGEFVSFYVTGSTFTWIADITGGTQVIFFMIDSQARQGGVSPLDTVAPLSNTSCLTVNSPSSTTSAPSQTSNQSTPSQTSNQGTPSQTSGSNTATTGIIAGSVVGGVVLVVLLIIIGICCIRKASRQSHHKDGVHEIRQNFTPASQTDSHFPFVQPENQSHLSASDPFSQYLRQTSYTDSFAGMSSVSSATEGQSASQNSTATFPYQTLPVGLTPPTHPGVHSRLTSAYAGNFAVSDPRAPSSQVRHSRLSSNLDAGSSQAESRRMGAVQIASQDYPFLYQAHSASQAAPPNHPATLSHYASADTTFTASDPPLPLPTQTSRLSSNTDRFASDAGSSSGGRITAAAGQATTNPSARIIMHTDIEDVPAARDAEEVIELPPQYSDRQLLALQPESTPNLKSSLS